MTRARPLPTGIVKTPTGFRSFVWVPDAEREQGRIRSKRWKDSATLDEMKRWREDQRVSARKPKPVSEAPDPLVGFIADAATYLDSVRALISIKNRVRDIGQWIAIFGETPSLQIESQRIRQARDQWMTVGPKLVLEKKKGERPKWISKPIALSPSAVNHRLRALENFFTVMYPKAENPVREVPEAIEPEPQPRGHSFALSLEILKYMPDVTRPVKGEAKEKGSLSRVRFEAMLWTGLPAVQLGKLEPTMVNWTTSTVLVPRRQKGRTSRRSRSRMAQRPRPLLPQAVDALKRFFALKANRPFSSSSLEKSVRKAVAAANRARKAKHLPALPVGLRVYDLTRHTFGTEAMRASRNLKAVQELMGHRDITQTERYAAAAVGEQTVLAIEQLGTLANRSRRIRQVVRSGGKVSPVKTSSRDRTQRTARAGNAR